MKNNKGIASIVIILIVAGVLVAGGYYFWSKNTQKQVACTEEAKICPDGSSVGRTGPNCDFAECPSLNTADWKTYRNEEYGYEVKYPKDWNYAQGGAESESEWKNASFEKELADKTICSFGVLKISEGYQVEEEIKMLTTERQYQKSNIVFAGLPAIKLVHPEASSSVTYYLQKNGKYYLMVAHTAGRVKIGEDKIYSAECMDYFNQMISTLKLI